MLNGRTELRIFDRASVTGDRYCEEVLLPHVRLFRGAIGPDFIFMDDNARPHRTLAVEELLESEDITRMDWPAYSPDLNPIEHAWDALGRRIAARLHHPENTQQLKQMLIEEWALLPQEMLHQLVLSMRRRCEATIAINFGTKYQPGEDVEIFISRVKTAATRLQEAGHKLDDLYIGFHTLIRWLPQEFQSTVQQIYRWKEEDFRVVKIEAELILEANRLQLMKQDLRKRRMLT
ncbi:transposable element Tcb2 transposase [Trichonephila clavipes]|nr:transposable element Tcb2 transposase [Trichonephila clavipes]